MNLPNKLSILRIVLVPFFMIFIIFPILPDTWSRIIGAAIFLLTSLTDMLDGMIARKYNLITDFGKFIDPLADKFMVFGALLSIMIRYSDVKYFNYIFVWVTAIVIFRELAVTSIRLLAANKEGIVIAANWLGKMKTVSQVVCILTILLEPVFIPSNGYILSYIMMTLMTVMTIWSGVNYLKAYWKFMDPTK